MALELDKSIEIAGHKVPVWFIILAAGVGVFGLIFANKSSETTTTPASSGGTTSSGTGTTTTTTTDLSAQIADATAQIQSMTNTASDLLSKSSAQYAAQLQTQQDAFSKQMQQMESDFRSEIASSRSSYNTPAQVKQVEAPTPAPAPVKQVEAPAPADNTYTVVPGDSLWKISRRYGLTLAEIEAKNPQFKNPNLIHPGETVYV
jgi:LysM repeat protein